MTGNIWNLIFSQSEAKKARAHRRPSQTSGRPKLRRLDTTFLPVYTPVPSPGERRLDDPKEMQAAALASISAQASPSQMQTANSLETPAQAVDDSTPPPKYEVYELSPLRS